MKKVPVNVIHVDGAAALVQWVERGKLNRTIVPSASVDAGEVAADELEAGLPYGDPFGDIKGVNAAVVEELRNRGIWVKADALANPRYVHDAVIVALVPPTIQAIMDYVKED